MDEADPSGDDEEGSFVVPAESGTVLGMTWGHVASARDYHVIKGTGSEYRFIGGDTWGLSFGRWSLSRDEEGTNEYSLRCVGQLEYQHYDMLLSRHNFHYGTLNLHTLSLGLKVHWRPADYVPVGAQFLVGIGCIVPFFHKSHMLEADDLMNMRDTRVSVQFAGASVAFGIGFDLYTSPETCLSLVLKVEGYSVPTNWKARGTPVPEYDDYRRFRVDNGQVILAYCIFF